MDVRTCKRCGTLFQYVTGEPLCYNCKQLEEQEFQKVKDFLYEHPKATMMEVCEETEIPTKQIRKYLRQGRLIIPSDSPMGIECERCGTRIQSGKYCSKCSDEISRQLKGITSTPVQNIDVKKNSGKAEKMRYLGRRKK